MMMYSGYGIVLDHIKTSIKDVKLLITLAPKLTEEVSGGIVELESGDDGYGAGDNAHDFATELTDGLWEDQDPGLGALLARVIEEREGIRLTSVCDSSYSPYEFLIFLDRAPWEYNEKERALTETTLLKMLHNYISILTVDHPENRNIDLVVKRRYIEVE